MSRSSIGANPCFSIYMISTEARSDQIGAGLRVLKTDDSTKDIY